MKRYLYIFSLFILIGCKQTGNRISADPYKINGEKHLQNIKMLTEIGENAEAYFSFDEKKLIYQSRGGDIQCDQIFTMNVDGSEKKLVSTGLGRTTCSYFFPDGKKIIYASTHAADSSCPAPPDYSQGYVWQVFNTYDLFIANRDGSDAQVLVPYHGYDAEATISPLGNKIAFTSQRNGDLDIYSMNLDGTDLIQLTDVLGYDGGPFFSWNGQKIVYRSYHPKTDVQKKRYRELLSDQLIEPAKFQIWIMDADGRNKKQITNNRYANFAPFYHPDNQRIIFCSSMNSQDPKRPDFNLWIINEDGSGLEQITYFDQFDGFPMFSSDGQKLVFASNRFNWNPRDTNVFIADWID